MSRSAAILLAAGSGRRMSGVVDDKILAPLVGRPVFTYSAAAFAASGVADFYAVVYRDRQQLTALAAHAPTPSVLVKGGRTRQDSVMNALAALPSDIEFVFIHDCARPLIQPDQLRALHKIVRRESAVILAHRVADTIKERCAGDRFRTLKRDALWAAETPQVFAHELIVRAYQRVADRELSITDDAAAVELLKHPIAILENMQPAPKLTTPADLAWLEYLVTRQQQVDASSHAVA